jgi:hypothetical protein
MTGLILFSGHTYRMIVPVQGLTYCEWLATVPGIAHRRFAAVSGSHTDDLCCSCLQLWDELCLFLASLINEMIFLFLVSPKE